MNVYAALGPLVLCPHNISEYCSPVTYKCYEDLEPPPWIQFTEGCLETVNPSSVRRGAWYFNLKYHATGRTHDGFTVYEHPSVNNYIQYRFERVLTCVPPAQHDLDATVQTNSEFVSEVQTNSEFVWSSYGDADEGTGTGTPHRRPRPRPDCSPNPS